MYHHIRCINTVLDNPTKPSSTLVAAHICRVGQNHIYTVYGIYTVFLAGKPPNIRLYTAYIYGSGQAYIFAYKQPAKTVGGKQIPNIMPSLPTCVRARVQH